MHRFIKTSFILVLLFLTYVQTSYASSVSLGSSFSSSTSNVDHSKYGISAKIHIKEKSKWSLLLSADALFSSFSVINPGAGNNPTAPDEEESKNGGMPAYLQVFLKTPYHWLKGELSLGMVWYFSSLSSAKAGSVPNAPALSLNWYFLQSKVMQLNFLYTLAFNPINTNPLVTLHAPELNLQFKSP